MTGVVEIVEGVNTGRFSALEVAEGALGRLRAVEGRIGAFLEVFEEEARAMARAVDARVAAGERPALAGVPVALKDNICLEWGRTTAASRFLEEYRSPYTASFVKRLVRAGAVIVGKTNLDEFAMGSSTEHSAFKPTRNPWDTSRSPGGSSGGSAAAVAAGVVPLAFGSDTGGSIRQPAGHCGVVGVKPTYGRVSRYGLIAFASSLDQVGPLTRTVRESAAALNVVMGSDPLDATTSGRGCECLVSRLEERVEGLTIGVPREARSGANHGETARVFEEAVRAAREAGAHILDVELAHAGAGVAAYYIVAPAEASSNLARFDGVRYGRRAAGAEGLAELYSRSRGEGFGAEVQRRIMLGTHVLSSGYYDDYYVSALRARRLIKGDYDACFAAGCHALLMPTSPGPAFRLGEMAGDPLAMYQEDVYTVGANLAGLPGIAVPAGLAEVEGARLPVGVQLIGRAFDEAVLLRAARSLERALGFAARPGVAC